MDKLLEGQTAIITGGHSGIGRGISNMFVAHGANLVIFGRNAERGEKAAEELRADAGSDQRIAFHQVSVDQTAATQEAIDAALKEFGSVEILVNNAGITRDKLLIKMTEEDWDAVIDCNLKAVYNTCSALIRPLMKARKGKIINISSVVGLTGNSGQINYAASKSGMIGLTKSLAKEVAKRGICVNCIAPGFIETQMTDVLNESQKAAIFETIPMGRMGTPEEIALAALFLASHMSNYVTGQVLTVDGGMVM